MYLSIKNGNSRIRKAFRGALGILVVTALCLGMAPLAYAGQMETGEAIVARSENFPRKADTPSGVSSSAQSGLLSVQKPTATSLRAAWLSVPAEPMGKKIFSTMPNVSKYKAGVLSSNALKYSKSYMNLIRTQANLGQVSFLSSLNASAAQAALINSRYGLVLDHGPAVPSGVTAAAARPGQYASGTSNLGLMGSVEKTFSVLKDSIQGCMDDADLHNIDSVGHRRWMLNPSLSAMGIGAAYRYYSNMNLYHTAMRVDNFPLDPLYSPEYGKVRFDNSVNYQYVAWPASGAMLNNLFSVGTPWSVSLNPSLYKKPVQSDVTVKVTRVSDGRTWTLSSKDSAKTTKKEYFRVDGEGCGEGSAIIFNPGKVNFGASKYSGTYSVKITGLKTTSGEATSLSYKVNFYSPSVSMSWASVGDISPKTYSGKNRIPAVTVKYGGKTLKKGTHYKVTYKNNKYVGRATVTIKGIGKCYDTVTKTFLIKPKGTGIAGLVARDDGFKVSWTKQTTQTSGYQIRYSTDPAMAGSKTVTVANNKTTSKSISGLEDDSAYYVQVRTYKTVNGVKYCSAWSLAKRVETT